MSRGRWSFCIATTNSTESIRFGDISIIEHQHVNMFTETSIHQILTCAGFSDIEVSEGSYGNTFHIVARKVKEKKIEKGTSRQKTLSLSYFENIKGTSNILVKFTTHQAS